MWKLADEYRQVWQQWDVYVWAIIPSWSIVITKGFSESLDNIRSS